MMGMFSGAREAADARLAGEGMGEFGEDPREAPAADPASELMMLIDQVPDPALADAMRQAAMKLTGGPPAEESAEAPTLEGDPVVAP